MTRNKKTPFKPWETTRSDGIEKRYNRIACTQLVHQATKSLTHSAFRVYYNMRMESAGKMIFEFPKHKWQDYLSAGGFQSAKKDLITKGFIEEIEKNANRRIPNVYCFSEKWKDYK